MEKSPSKNSDKEVFVVERYSNKEVYVVGMSDELSLQALAVDAIQNELAKSTGIDVFVNDVGQLCLPIDSISEELTESLITDIYLEDIRNSPARNIQRKTLYTDAKRRVKISRAQILAPKNQKRYY